jgi:heavy metal sensor kinase
MTWRALERRLDESLSGDANIAAALLDDEFAEEKGDTARAVSEALLDLRMKASTVVFLGAGKVLGSSGPISTTELAEVNLGAGAHSETHFVIAVARAGANGARAAITRVRLGGMEYLAVVIQPLDEVVADVAVLHRVLLVGLPLLIGLAGIGGYWLTRRNLAPLASMAEQARSISHSNLETRLEIGQAAEELAVLSVSFNELLSRLDQSFEHMRRFVADASHELRTPVAIIRGEADVALSSDRSATEYRQTLAVILDESRRLSRLVDDLLNLARADAGRVRLQVTEFYLNDLLAECCRSEQTLASARGVVLECRADGDVAFRGDEELVHRMVRNLIDNAIRYTPEGGRVTVVLETAADRVLVRVSDTGAGIAPAALPHLFERFYRADKARSRQDGGFGLGLAIVKWIAESHRGTVAVESTVGEGSTFTVTVPR